MTLFDLLLLAVMAAAEAVAVAAAVADTTATVVAIAVVAVDTTGIICIGYGFKLINLSFFLKLGYITLN